MTRDLSVRDCVHIPLIGGSPLPAPARFARGVVFGVLGGAFLWMIVAAFALLM